MSKKFRIIRQIGWIAFECLKNSALDKMALKIRNLYDNNPRVMNFFEFLIEFFRHQILLSKFFCRRFYSRKNYVQELFPFISMRLPQYIEYVVVGIVVGYAWQHCPKSASHLDHIRPSKKRIFWSFSSMPGLKLSVNTIFLLLITFCHN